MTDDQLAAICPRGCGRTVGQHLVPFHRDDCTWTNDAKCHDYNGAQQRYEYGLWSLDQWEAYQRLHTFSRHSMQYHNNPPSPEVRHFMDLLEAP